MAERLDQEPGKCADVRATMATNLGLVAHAAHRDAIELSANRLGDRLA
jgi:hypothetical protein